MIVRVWCRRLLRMSAEKWVGMYLCGMEVVHAACLLARRNMPWDAGEVEGRMMRNLWGYGLIWARTI
jgi:hypothetical protein